MADLAPIILGAMIIVLMAPGNESLKRHAPMRTAVIVIAAMNVVR